MSFLSSQYIISQQQEKSQESYFAAGIALACVEHKELLSYLNKRDRRSFAECLQEHYEDHLTTLRNNSDDIDLISQFEGNIKNLLEVLTNTSQNIATTKKITKPKVDEEINQEDLELLTELITNAARKCQKLFSDQKAYPQVIDKLQAQAIAFNCDLTLKQQLELVDKLLLVKGLWQVANNENDSLKLLLHMSPKKLLQDLHFNNHNEAFETIVKILGQEQPMLNELSNESLIELYDGLKKIEPQSSFIFNMLKDLHYEAQLRYTYNRLSDAGYELLTRFQSYDAITNQINNAEFAIAEAFLLRRSNFIHEIIIAISKQVDNIRAVGAANMQAINNALHKIKAELAHSNLEGNVEHKDFDTSLLPTIKKKLSEPLEAHVQKRYIDIDKFIIAALTERYTLFFKHINQLIDLYLDDKASDISFLKDIIIRKLAQEYHPIHLPNSMPNLRIIAEDRKKIAQQLEEIDFLDIFMEQNNSNFTSLNFRKHMVSKHQKHHSYMNAAEYIRQIIQALLTHCNAAQLEKLYKPLLHQTALSAVKLMLKQEIIKQIKQRTTISKLIYAIFVGTKHEFDKLKSMKGNFQHIEKLDNARQVQ